MNCVVCKRTRGKCEKVFVPQHGKGENEKVLAWMHPKCKTKLKECKDCQSMFVVDMDCLSCHSRNSKCSICDWRFCGLESDSKFCCFLCAPSDYRVKGHTLCPLPECKGKLERAFGQLWGSLMLARKCSTCGETTGAYSVQQPRAEVAVIDGVKFVTFEVGGKTITERAKLEDDF